MIGLALRYIVNLAIKRPFDTVLLVYTIGADVASRLKRKGK